MKEKSKTWKIVKHDKKTTDKFNLEYYDLLSNIRHV